jgi:hypothetical protein
LQLNKKWTSATFQHHISWDTSVCSVSFFFRFAYFTHVKCAALFASYLYYSCKVLMSHALWAHYSCIVLMSHALWTHYSCIVLMSHALWAHYSCIVLMSHALWTHYSCKVLMSHALWAHYSCIVLMSHALWTHYSWYWVGDRLRFFLDTQGWTKEVHYEDPDYLINKLLQLVAFLRMSPTSQLSYLPQQTNSILIKRYKASRSETIEEH